MRAVITCSCNLNIRHQLLQKCKFPHKNANHCHLSNKLQHLYTFVTTYTILRIFLSSSSLMAHIQRTFLAPLRRIALRCREFLCQEITIQSAVWVFVEQISKALSSIYPSLCIREKKISTPKLPLSSITPCTPFSMTTSNSRQLLWYELQGKNKRVSPKEEKKKGVKG